MRLTFFFFILFFSFIIYAGSAKMEKMKTPQSSHSLIYFKDHISQKLTANKAREIFGAPEKDLGSGLYIYEYPVKEGGRITLSFSSYLLTAIYLSDRGQEILFKTTNDRDNLKHTLSLHESIEIQNGAISLYHIEIPEQKLPGNRPIFYLSFLNIPSGPKNGKQKTIFKFDPFNSGKEYQFGQAKFRIFTHPDLETSLLIQSTAGN